MTSALAERRYPSADGLPSRFYRDRFQAALRVLQLLRVRLRAVEFRNNFALPTTAKRKDLRRHTTDVALHSLKAT